MSEVVLERTVRFSASHRYRRSEWSAERNRQAFGPVADPHVHDYAVTVSVRGEMDAYGFVVDLDALDAALAGVVDPLDQGDLNRQVFTDGRVQPSTEALARWLWVQMEDRIPPPARLVRVRVAESAGPAAVWEG